ncbi:MAG: twin-arginine translocase subunit TatB [Rhodospirillales bacterium]|nr:Sec-independent protein translocase protein TatB [Rhodospirillales bacterium]MDE2198696.1 twin-arginine translocase subunit TatB [Rhodospirillales bacterium]MDE2577110.1 twin-arginine translocase subunit TatB [Rhodospirillales bacterium]
MFNFSWMEIAMIGVVALVAIGPKDMPVAIRTIAEMIKKARRMAGEFQGHFDEMVREANLGEVRDQINELRNFDIKGTVERAIDPDGTLADTFSGNPFEPAASTATEIGQPAEHTIAAPEGVDRVAHAGVEAPAFIPPEIANRPEPPAFIPPDAIRY